MHTVVSRVPCIEHEEWIFSVKPDWLTFRWRFGHLLVPPRITTLVPLNLRPITASYSINNQSQCPTHDTDTCLVHVLTAQQPDANLNVSNKTHITVYIHNISLLKYNLYEHTAFLCIMFKYLSVIRITSVSLLTSSLLLGRFPMCWYASPVPCWISSCERLKCLTTMQCGTLCPLHTQHHNNYLLTYFTHTEATWDSETSSQFKSIHRL